jgi:hypothetical protein
MDSRDDFLLMQGKRILIIHPGKASQNLEQVILLPACQKPFALDASFAGFLLLEQVQGNVTKQSKVFWSMLFTNPATVFIKSKIKAQCNSFSIPQ